MVGSSANMETAASTPSLVLLEHLMDSPEGGSGLKSYPSSRTSLPNLSPGGNGRSKWPQSLLQDFLRSSSRRSRRKAPEGTPDPPPVTRRIWCDSEECLQASPFIKIQQFPQNGQCQNCGQAMKDVATNTEVVQDAKPSGEFGSSQGLVTRDTEQSEPSIEEAVTKVVRRPRKNPNLNRVSFDEKSSRRRSLPTALDWWSDKVLKRQSSNLKDNVRKSWGQDENDLSPYGPRSVSDQAINQTVVGASRTSINAIKPESPRRKASSQWTLSDNGGWFRAKKELKHVSKSTPNLSYPSTQVDKLESARLAAWWEESPFPVRSQRFTFRSHSSGQKVVLRKGHSSYEVSAKGKRRQSTNLADLEDLMGAVSGSEEETETDGECQASRAFLLPYQALQEEMDARSGNFNHSNSKDAIPAIRIDAAKEHRTPQRPSTLLLDHLVPKTPETLSMSTPYINGSGPVSNDWSFSSPSLESVIHSQFLRNTSLTSLHHHQSHHHHQRSFRPTEGLGTPKRLQSGRRSGTKRKDLLRHSWAGRPNPLSTSMLKLAKGERSSWVGVVNELPVIPEDRSKEKARGQCRSLFRLQGSHSSLLGSTVQYHEATSGLGSEEPQLDPEEDDHLRSLDTKHPHLLTGEFLVKRNSRSKPPFQGRVSPPTSYFNPWVLQPQQLRKKLESLQQQEEGGGNDWRNGVPKQMKPELIVVDIFDDSQELSCGDKDCKMPQESIMEDPISESVANMDALEDVSRDLEGDATLEQSGNSPPRFVRSVSSIPSRNRQVSVDSVSGANQRTEKHARTTNNNRRSLSPQAREYASRLNASGKQRSQSQASSGENDDQQTNGYRQRKKSLALAMNEGRLEMKEVCMRPLDVDLDFHLIAQLNQLNRELMDLSKSGSSTSPSSPGVGANHSFSLLENNSEILADGDTKHSVSSSPQSPNSLQVQQTKHSPGNDMYSPISSRRGRSPVEAKQKKFSYDSPRRKQSDENVTPVFSSKKSSPEQRTISENSKESKSVSPREVISRIKSRFSNPKLTRGSPQRSSAGKIEIQILRPNLGNSENESGPFKRSASLRNDSDSRKTWPSLEASTGTEGYEENSQSPSGQSHVYRRSESDGPLERQRKKPVLPDSNPMIEQNHNAPGSSTDSGLGKDQRHSKSSADSLLEDFHVSSQVSSRCNSNPPSRPLSSDTGDLSWEKGRDLLSPRLRGFPGYLSSSTPHSPTNLTPATGSREDLLDDGFSRPESQEDLLGSRGNGMRASGSSQGSSISHAMQSGIKPPKPRHKPLRRSKTDLGDPSIIKAALTLAKMQGDETPKAVEGSSRMPSATKKRPTSALGIMGILNSGSGRESPVTQVTQPDGKPSPRLQRSQHQPAPEPLSLVVDIDVEQDKTVSDLPLTPRPRSRSLGSLGTFEIPDMALMKRALSLPAGLGDDEVMMSDPDLSKINARMSETFEQFCAATLAEALFDHVTMDGNELTFQAGDMIEITDMTDAYWWWGCIDKQEGWLPAPFVRLKVSQGETVEECMSRLQVNTSSNQQGLKPSHEPLIRKVSLSFLSNDQVRANVIKEIITTERDYVKNLADIYEGYIEQARSRPDMFNQTLMSKLFCNIEEIYCFQQRFLTDLEQCINNDLPHKSAIGDCFLKYKLTFDIYGEYCNNYPHAVNEFQELMKDNKYVQFFEACRLLQSMIKIQLDGFLLTPVQKICKYPLQLNELLKYTRPQHPDFQPLKSALEAMREVAQSINERKRRIEHIENIALWQKTIGDWEGDDVLDRSSMLIYSDEVNRVSLTGRHRTSPRQLFLFDHQLIICRKLWVDEWIDKTRKGEISGKEYLTASVYMWRDILRRDLYVYKDRIDLDDCQIEDLPDGKENEWNVTLRYAWKIQNFEDQSKVYVFMCRSRKEKRRWLRHFAKERKIVHEGLTRGSSFMAAKEAALKTSTTNKPSKPTDRVTVRRALSMPHRKVRDPNGKEPPLQLPRMASTEVEPDVSTPKKKGISLFGVQFGKK